jgi:hypothetical protein
MMREWLSQFLAYIVEQAPWAWLSVAGGLIVGISTTVAVFAPRVRDTLLERICLASISIGAYSRAIFIYVNAEVPVDGAWTAITLGIYCLVIWWKYCYVIPRRKDFKPDSELED